MTTSPPETALRAPRTGRRLWWRWALASLGLVALAVWVGGRLGERAGLQALQAQALEAAASQAGVAALMYRQFAALPFVLAQDLRLQATLAEPDDVRRQSLNVYLQRLAEGTGAPVIYLLDATGYTLAASNWNEPDSFVAHNYGYRPYFQEAQRIGASSYVAFGSASQRTGLYLSRQLAGAIPGVVIVKQHFDALEQVWRESPNLPVLVTDPRGVVLFASQPDWHFRTLVPLAPAARAALQASRQFGDAPLDPLPVRVQERDSHALWRTAGGTLYLPASADVPGTDWTLHVLAPVAPAVPAATRQGRLWGLLAALALAGAAAAALGRRQRLLARERRQQATERALSAAVTERTTQLRAANQQLESDMVALREARARARALRDQLEHAEKLSSLGQIAAGVAHEINQPLTAIQTYAETTGLLLAHGQPEQAQRNLERIGALTTRIGGITAQLRRHARRAVEEPSAVSLRAALDNTLLLLEHRARQQGVVIDSTAVQPEHAVLAVQSRLEQVLLNLLRNALDALQGQVGGRITLRVSPVPAALLAQEAATATATDASVDGLDAHADDADAAISTDAAASADAAVEGDSAAGVATSSSTGAAPPSPEGVPTAARSLSAAIAAASLPPASSAAPTPPAPVLTLVLADNGPGLTAEQRARLFIPFQSTRPEGLGLGLVIARDITQAMHGELRAAAATDGHGAVFLLQLPRATP